MEVDVPGVLTRMEDTAAASPRGDLADHSSAAVERALQPVHAWWALTTQPQFLSSSASRRDAWGVLLPLYGPLAMCTDAALDSRGFVGVTGDWGVAFLDVAMTAALLLATQFRGSSRRLWSDCVVVAVHLAHAVLHRLLAPDEEDSAGACQVLSLLVLTSGGLHSAVIAFFLLLATCAQPVVAPAARWRPELLMLCVYVLCLGGLAEHRTAQLFSARRLGGRDEELRRGRLSGKTSSRDPELSRLPYSSAQAGFQETRGGGFGQNSAGGSYIFSEGECPSSMMGPPLAPPEEPEPPPPPPPPPAASGRLGWLSSSLLTPDWSPRGLLSDYVFSRFMPQGDLAGHSPRQGEAKKLQTVEVPMVAASNHDAPDFDEADFLPPPPKKASSTAVPSGTRQDLSEDPPGERRGGDALSPRHEAKKEPPSELRALKLGGFALKDLNVLFIEVHDPNYELNGFPSYWSKSGSHFLYYDRELMTWAMAVAKTFKQTRGGASHYIALGPEGYWDVERLRGKGWRERDAKTGQMADKPSKKAVVETLGKVKPPPARKAAKPAKPS